MHRLFNSCYRLILSFMLAIAGTAPVFAGEDPVNTAPLLGSQGQVTVNAESIVKDANLFYAAADPTAPQIEQTYFTKNMVSVGIDENTLFHLKDDFTATLVLRITKYNQAGSVVDEFDRSFTINYKRKNGDKYDAIQYYPFENACSVKVKIMSINSSTGPSWDPNVVVSSVLRVDNMLTATRDYIFNCTKLITGLELEYQDITDELAAKWTDPRSGQTEYDLEWAWVDAASYEEYQTGGDFDEAKIFKNNGTRVTIEKPGYSIPLLYDGEGRIFVRVRPAQLRVNGQRIQGTWHSYYLDPNGGASPQNGMVSYEFGGHEGTFNWQASTSYAEDGKRKSVIQYFDGSLRSRQTVTKDNSAKTPTTVVAETMYDYQGRPVIQVLPAPTLSTIIEYSHTFNKTISTAYEGYPKWAYDKLETNAAVCGNPAMAMSTAKGAANYYSPANTLSAFSFAPNKHQYIPTAEGPVSGAAYPFTETRFAPDGRPMAQGGVGITHQLGSTHETKYFYESPAQEELDALFGTDAGVASHYFKNLVRDANGQYSVSYSDMHGRTVATALAGVAPTGMDSLLSSNTQNFTRQLIDAETNLVSGNSIVSTKNIVVPKKGLYSFKYEMHPEQLKLLSCDDTPICYDCIYKLEISVTADCYTDNDFLVPFNYVDDNFTLGESLDFPVCREGELTTSFFLHEFNLTLPEGSYTITKRLTLSDSARRAYRDVFMANNTCKTFQEFYDTEYQVLLSQSNCAITCESCTESVGSSFTMFRQRFLAQSGMVEPLPADLVTQLQAAYNEALANCTKICNEQNNIDDGMDIVRGIRKTMLQDVTPPSGQYAQRDDLATAFNIFNLANPLNYSNVNNYTDEFGQPETVDPGLTPAQFSEQFKTSWATALLPLHPEYPKLVTMETLLPAAYQFEATLLATDKWTDAANAGYINAIVANDPFFNGTVAGGSAYASAMNVKLNWYHYVNGAPGCNQLSFDASAWTLAQATVFCRNVASYGPCHNEQLNCIASYYSAPSLIPPTGCITDWDHVWKIYRTLYLTERKKLISTFIKANSTPDKDAIILSATTHPNHIPERKLRLRILDMNLNSSTLANINAGDLETFFNQLSAGTDPGTIGNTAGNLATAQYAETCNGYKDMWIAQLEQCPLIATRWENPANRTADIDWLTPRLVKICTEGSDAGHYLGSSSINPAGTYAGYPNPGGSPALLKAFPEVINQFLVNAGISADALCHPYLITSPAPYEFPAPVTAQMVITKPTDCECTKITTLKNQYQQIGTGYGSFSNFLRNRYGSDIGEADLNTLLSLCAGTSPCIFIPTPIKLPAVMQCLSGSNNTTIVKPCIDCKDFQLLRTGFQSVFGVLAPIKEPVTDNDVNINTAFAKYANTKTGFSKNITEYIAFLDQCGGINPGTCDSLNNIVKNFILSVKKGRVTHTLSTDSGASYSNLAQIANAGVLRFPDNVRNIYSGWYNNYGFGLTSGSFCLSNGYSVEIRLKYNTNRSGHIFYLQLAEDYSYTIKRSGGSIYITVGGVDYLMDNNANAIYNWMDIKVKLMPDRFYFYYNDNLITSVARNPATPIANRTGFGLGIIGRLYNIDRVRVWDGNDNVKYFEDFNNISQPAFVDSSFICPKPNCELEFRNYFNQQRGTNYTYAQIDSFYRAKCGQSPMPCSQVSSCSPADILVKNYQEQYITPASGYVDYDLRTLSGNKTPQEGPKGVFDINNNLIGNAEGINTQAIKEAYVEIWNSSTVNQAVGTLSLLQNGKYRLTLLPGKAAPCNGIIGMRYYQFEASIDTLDALITGPGCYVDFGDGSREFITKGLNARGTVVYDYSITTAPSYVHHPQDSALVQYYTRHAYSTENVQARLVTVYHPDVLGCFGFDNVVDKTQLDIRYIKKLKGYMPQQTFRVVFHSTQDSTLNTFAQVKNFSQVKTITYLNLGNGYGYNTATELGYMRFPSFANNKNISNVWIDEGTEPQFGYQTVASLLPDMKANFPKMTSLVLLNRKGTYNNNVDFSIAALRHLNISGTLTSTQLDSIIIQVARTAQDSGALRLYHGNGTVRTSLSDAAFNTLVAKKWDLKGGGMNVNNTLPADRVLKTRDSLPMTSQFAEYYNTIYGTTLSHNQVMQALQTTYGYIPDYCTPMIKVCNDSVKNAGPMLCGLNTPLFNEIPYEDDPCSNLPQIAYNAAEIKWELYLDSLRGVFDAAYTAKCMSAGKLESFTVNYDVKEYHYTLYYYDQAGNLVKTVPPAGVNAKHSNTAFLDAVKAARARVAAGESETAVTPHINTVTPFHTLTTSYRYNTLNQVVEQKTPDADISKFWYDRLGRLVVSQNAKQANASQPGGKKYSYTLYDELGRIEEVGQKPQTASISQTITKDPDNLLLWLNGNGASNNVWNKEEITRTRYDLSYEAGSNILGAAPSIFVQRNLRNRVSYSMVFDTEPTPGNPAITHRAATFYTYDIHGNVDTLLQDLRMAMMSTTSNRYKKIAYDYDLISGKVNKVAYQAGMQDQFYHRYAYDNENRLTDVFTSHDNLIWERDARYGYYKHGPLARMELGQQSVQGVDYAYTLQGWLKGINSTAAKQLDIVTGEGADCGPNSAVDHLLVNTRTQPYINYYKATSSITFEDGFESTAGDGFLAEPDAGLASCGTNGTAGTVIPAPLGTNYHDMGMDGMETLAGVSTVASDVYGLGLNYFAGDYKAIYNTANPFASAPAPPVAGFTTGMSLYNGNIRSMAVNIPKLGPAYLYAYRYDQLNRLRAMDAFTGLNDVNNLWTPVATDQYKERASYDANGNILTYNRNGNTAALQMDKLTYQYAKYANTPDNVSKGIVGKIMNNRLRYVFDDYTTAMTEDIESNTALSLPQVEAEMLEAQAGDNYQYDEIGNLVKDEKENIDVISWNVYGKIKSIDKKPGYADISYTYDAMGNRISKTVTPPSGSAVTTIYVRDASGNVMAVYNAGGTENNGDLTQKEVHLYGSSRLGIYNTDRNVQILNTAAPNDLVNSFARGNKFFELSNHLGNVLVTITDKKLSIDENDNGFASSYEAEVVNANDYYPFGMIMPGRKFSSGDGYRYGFNGQENSDEIFTNSTTALFWEYDSRIGRRWNIDPKSNGHESAFSTFSDNPIIFSDLLGDVVKYGKKDKSNVSDSELSEFRKKVNQMRRNSPSFRKMYRDLNKSKTNVYTFTLDRNGEKGADIGDVENTGINDKKQQTWNININIDETAIAETKVGYQNGLIGTIAHESGHAWRRLRGIETSYPKDPIGSEVKLYQYLSSDKNHEYDKQKMLEKYKEYSKETVRVWEIQERGAHHLANIVLSELINSGGAEYKQFDLLSIYPNTRSVIKSTFSHKSPGMFSIKRDYEISSPGYLDKPMNTLEKPKDKEYYMKNQFNIYKIKAN